MMSFKKREQMTGRLKYLCDHSDLLVNDEQRGTVIGALYALCWVEGDGWLDELTTAMVANLDLEMEK